MTHEHDIIKMEIRKSIGKRICEARKKKGMTTRQLADKCGLSQSHIVRVETGRYAVTIDTIAIIAKALGLKLQLDMD